MDPAAARFVVLADRLGVELIGPDLEPGLGEMWLTYTPNDGGRPTRIDLLGLFERLADRVEALEAK